MDEIKKTERRKTIAKSRYTLGGWLMPEKITQQRIYEPTYQLTSKLPVNFDHVQIIIRNCVMQDIEYTMPTYDATNAMRIIKNITNAVKFRIQIQNFDRYRVVVIGNVMEKGSQGMNWQVGTLFDSTRDGWTKLEYETPTYILSVFVACIYWD